MHFFILGASRGCQITKTDITYELDILQASPLKVYRILVVIHLKHIKSILLLLADTFLEKC